VALGGRADYWLEVLGEGGSLMRFLMVGFSLFLFVGGCASLDDKCVNVKIGKAARADIIIGPWASISIQGPGVWQSAPKDLGFNGCRAVSSGALIPTP